MTPEMSGASADDRLNASSDQPQSPLSSEAQFAKTFVQNVLLKHTSCMHFLDTPVLFTDKVCAPPAPSNRLSITVKQLHLATPVAFCVSSSATLRDVIEGYQREMEAQGQTPIPFSEQRWLFRGKSLLDTRIAICELGPESTEFTFHLVRKPPQTARSEKELLQALRSFEDERSSGQGHTCSDSKCSSSISFLLNHLKE